MAPTLTAPKRPLASVAAIALLGVAYVLLFPDRTDYAGHFLAGAGGTMLLVALVVAVRPQRPWTVVSTVMVAVLLGVGTEATVFRLAEFDPVDLANQSIGAVLAGIGMIDGEDRPASTGIALLAGVLLLIVGFNYAFA